MSITLQDLADRIRATLSAVHEPAADDSVAKTQICSIVSEACLDQTFIAEHMKPRNAGENVRAVLYEDQDYGFCICAHVYADPDHGDPHDHGSSWAIYGQAAGETEMSDWTVVRSSTNPVTKWVEKSRTYRLQAGDVHLYDIGDIHSPSRDAAVKLLRIEGSNLDHIERSNIKRA